MKLVKNIKDGNKIFPRSPSKKSSKLSFLKKVNIQKISSKKINNF